jgi:hypothetical protein
MDCQRLGGCLEPQLLLRTTFQKPSNYFWIYTASFQDRVDCTSPQRDGAESRVALGQVVASEGNKKANLQGRAVLKGSAFDALVGCCSITM